MCSPTRILLKKYVLLKSQLGLYRQQNLLTLGLSDIKKYNSSLNYFIYLISCY